MGTGSKSSSQRRSNALDRYHALRHAFGTQSVPGCIPTQSVGAISEQHKKKNPMISHGVFRFQRPLLRRGRGTDQVVECAQGSLGALAHRDHDLLVRHGGHVTGGEYARYRCFATGIDDDLATG